jgi:hypothetical protein
LDTDSIHWAIMGDKFPVQMSCSPIPNTNARVLGTVDVTFRRLSCKHRRNSPAGNPLRIHLDIQDPSLMLA